jgi:hypothetical protein
MKTIIVISFLLISTTLSVFAQTNMSNQDSLTTKPKSKKQIYIDNYIANFPYKNTDIYEVIKQTNLWDTTGVVPVINVNTISVNRKPKVAKDNNLEIEQKNE